MIELPFQCKRERYSTLLALSSFLGSLISLALIFTGQYVYGVPSLILCVYLFKVAIYWFFNLKRHFEFDSESGVVNLVTLDNEKKEVKQVATSSEIEAFAVAGIKNWSRTGNTFGASYWTYHIVMVLKNGKIVQITPLEGSCKHLEVLKQAEKLANAMGCKLFESVQEQALEIKAKDSGVEISNRPWRFMDSFIFQGRDILYALSLIGVILLSIVGMAICLS